MKSIVNIVAVAVMALFAGIWIWIDWRVWHFMAPGDGERFPLSVPVITVAGFLGSTISTATAAVLGIKIGGAGWDESGNKPSISERVNSAVSASPVLMTGVLVYFFVGFVTLIVWLANPNEAPDLTNSFATGVLGWAVGAFSAVFKADPPPGGGGAARVGVARADSAAASGGAWPAPTHDSSELRGRE